MNNKWLAILWGVLGIFYVARVVYEYSHSGNIRYLNLVLACLFIGVSVYRFTNKGAR
jgi:heme/copper-type cytochrome/quinol oxidase subunit 3